MYRVLLLLSCFLIVTPNLYAQDTPCKSNQCIIVIDAGSTGSRLHVFSYELDETNTPIHINEIWNKKVKPGFASIEPNANTINAYLDILFIDAPKEDIPVYFYATGGMRLLPTSRQKKYYDELKRWFGKQDHWPLAEAKTITGSDEALYDWLSVNYHLDTLHAIQEHSIGVMDMGGASVQIVFPVEKDSSLDKKSQVNLNLYGHNITLSVHSFLGLGQTEVSHQFLNAVSCFSNNYPLPDGEMGQGNANACEQDISSLMNNVHKVNSLIQPLLVRNPVSSWYTMGGISNLAENPLFHFSNQQLTNENLLQQADTEVCHQRWEDLDNQFPNDDYVSQYCLLSSYYYALMVDGYGLNPGEMVNYIPPEKNLDWTLGVVLHRVPTDSRKQNPLYAVQ